MIDQETTGLTGGEQNPPVQGETGNTADAKPAADAKASKSNKKKTAAAIKKPAPTTKVDGVTVGLGGDSLIMVDGEKTVIKEATKEQIARLKELGRASKFYPD